MAISFSRLGNSIPFSGLFRKLEQEMETVIRVLQPGPLGIIEHKFSAEEMRRAQSTVREAINNWRRNTSIEKQSNISSNHI
ncbi:unnamed protein product [Citrullus colocynthis]|uniref:Uncharacterized protein n=1 Tax=Citrullus colocynthis TaxID=252529 RepID=A0ABP0XPJ2_9ROSI